MKIEREDIPQMCIEAFAEANDLVMEIIERPLPIGDGGRYYAKFKKCEVKDGGCLVGKYGNGATPEEAIKAYAPQISLRTLVFSAMSGDRLEIRVPRLT